MKNIDKAFISCRISPQHWLADGRFSELLGVLERYKGVTDEVTLFTAHTHALSPLDVLRDRAEIMAGL